MNLNTKQVHPTKLRQALTMDVLATDLAEYLVRKGVSCEVALLVTLAHPL